ncbi:glycoside hydrolase, end-alpha-1,4-polygalactosaminidase [Marinitoga piezophila KA3]|uniref:Glycoside hydrolase, end-alpha-1,4-polygalactosaminidase n=1 Tax=Marinitoga piezophila (strain DSM 14283 / JCM 11233 / KA3) TaxID=443254 RepID=H2J744_MARPK|nr:MULTISPECIES: MJ1477/TM1410 family putative glycoside hydrolase [Marinitoga]AEX86414.1 glycoside hydrolase, end-alpha-1,4-polygalactosaminidase [Marinitoga piezophila KA3]APT76803.1 hypothetical protein LN42_10770 [Marinitoga sp. 1137]
MKIKVIIVIISTLIILLSCSFLKPNYENRYFVYQLQNINIQEIITYPVNFLVMDYSRTGLEDGKYTYDEIKKLKGVGMAPICYLSIGEAEDYRYYWHDEWKTNPPSWLGPENPDWEGNYKVKYWNEDWKKIIYDYLDKIIDMGFSGVYLDIIDAYYYWSNEGEAPQVDQRPIEETAKDMIDFVVEIANYARSKKENFLIIPQNGEDILDYDNNGIYLKTISGIGIEDLFYDSEQLDNGNYLIQKSTETEYKLKYINKILSSGKVVLSVDYVVDEDNINIDIIDDYIKNCRDRGIIPYPAYVDRELDRLSTIIYDIEIQ